MATCPTCGCDLPGTETLCRDCFEKQYAAMSAPTTIWRRLHPWWMPLSIAGIFGLLFLAPDWYFRYVDPPMRAVHRLVAALGVTVIVARWVVSAGLTGMGIWDSLKSRSWRVLLLWLMYVPNIVGLALWTMTGSGIWLTVTFAGILLAWAETYRARRRGLI